MSDSELGRYSHAFQGKSFLVTGGLGFIGSSLAHRLSRIPGARILVVDSLEPGMGGSWKNLEGTGRNVEVDIFPVQDRAKIAQAVSGRDFVFSLAGQVSHLDSMRDPWSDLASNCSAQLALLEACRLHNRDARIIFTSTRQVYGRQPGALINEDHPVSPIDINGIHKSAAEGYYRVYAQAHGLRSTVLRLTNTYGPRQLISHSRQGFFGWFLRNALVGAPIEVFGEGCHRRMLNFVSDVVDALLAIASHEGAWGEVFNLGSEEIHTIAELAQKVVEIAGSGSWRLVPFPESLGRIDIGDCGTDYSRIRKLTGWHPRVSLEEGIRRTLEFYRENQDAYLYPVPPRSSPRAVAAG